MCNMKPDLQKEIEQVFDIKKKEIKGFRKIKSSNIVYSFIVKDDNYAFAGCPNSEAVTLSRKTKTGYKGFKGRFVYLD